MKLEDLKSLKRVELQKLAKKHGVKANMKNENIIAALSSMENGDTLLENKPENVPLHSVNENPNSEDQKNIDVSLPKDTENRIGKRGRKRTLKSTRSKNSQDTESPNIDISPKNGLRSQIELLSMTPPWESDSFNSTPEQEKKEKPKSERRVSSASPIKRASVDMNRRRTRSSSRNRTPQSTNVASQPVVQKRTFSVGKSRVLPRVPQEMKKDTKPKQKKLKRRSTAHSDDEAVQTKRAKHINPPASNQEENSEEIDQDLQREILDEIRKKVDEADKKAGIKSTEETFSSQIPRFRATGVRIGGSKPVTPGNKDWNKLHHKKFEQLESIDDYERRKRERAEKLLGSNQKNMVTVSRLAKPTQRGPKIVKPITRGRPKPTFLSPVTQKRGSSKLYSPHSAAKPVKSALKTNENKNKETAKVFVPTVTSTKKMNLDFASRTSKLATPKRVTIVSDQKEKKTSVVGTPAAPTRTPTAATTPRNKRKSVATPLRGNLSSLSAVTPSSAKKNVFDLKESLKKPMSWVPHKGPLRPFNDPAKKPSFQERLKMSKQPAVKSRSQRREKMAAERKNAKDKRMLMRRGIK